MNVQDIIALTKAGFTKDEILQLASIPKEQAAPEEPKEEAPVPAPKEETKEEFAVDTHIDDVIAKLEKLSSGMDAKLEKLSSGMEQLAIKTSRMPERETADQALARIINPYIESTGTGGLNNGSK